MLRKTCRRSRRVHQQQPRSSAASGPQNHTFTPCHRGENSLETRTWAAEHPARWNARERPVACSGPLQSLLRGAEWALRLPCWALGQAPHVGCTASPLVLVAEGSRIAVCACGFGVGGAGTGRSGPGAGRTVASAEVCRSGLQQWVVREPGPLRELCLLQGPDVGRDLPGPAVASLVLGPAEGSRVLAQPARLGGCWLVSPALQRRGQARGRLCQESAASSPGLVGRELDGVGEVALQDAAVPRQSPTGQHLKGLPHIDVAFGADFKVGDILLSTPALG